MIDQELLECSDQALREMVAQLEDVERESKKTIRELRKRLAESAQNRNGFRFKDSAELHQSVVRGWGFALCQPGTWLEVHATYAEDTVNIDTHTSSAEACEKWGELLTQHQKNILASYAQGIIIVHDFGCDVHPDISAQACK